MLPIVTTPRIVSGLAGSRDGVETPSLFTSGGIVRHNEPANTKLTAANTNNYFIFHHERRHRDRVAKIFIPYFDIPERLTIRRIKRDQVCVQRAHEHLIIEHRHPTVVRTTADPRILRRCVPVEPEDPAGSGIHCHDIIGSLGDIHNPVDNDRVRLPGPKHLILEHPF